MARAIVLVFVQLRGKPGTNHCVSFFDLGVVGQIDEHGWRVLHVQHGHHEVRRRAC